MVAQLLRVRNGSIMLLKEGSDEPSPKLWVLAHHGFLLEAAYGEPVSLNQRCLVGLESLSRFTGNSANTIVMTLKGI